MNPKIHLLYFPECPNWKAVKENLCAVLKPKNNGIEWTEINLQSPECPESWRGFPSPTILVNGIDIQSGKHEMKGAPSCRSNGLATKDLILSSVRDRRKG